MNEQTVTFAALLFLIVAVVVVVALYVLPMLQGIHLAIGLVR